jgi:hypothetical protein
VSHARDTMAGAPAIGGGSFWVSVDAVPLRPMTVAEVLDAAVAVVRYRPWPLIAAAVLAAAAEQAVLLPIRRAAFASHDVFFTAGDYWHALATRPGPWWLLVAVGMGTEAMIFAGLGGLTGRRATDRLLAGLPSDTAGAPGWSVGRVGQLALVALIAGVGAAVGFFAGLVPWLFWFAISGLAAPALVIDGPRGGALGAFRRSFRLAFRAGLRPGALRLLSYLTWFVLRLLVGALGLALLASQLPGGSTVAVVGYAVWTAVNAAAYASIASLDATIHLETRMRLEGLDIALGRARATGRPVASVLGAPR